MITKWGDWDKETLLKHELPQVYELNVEEDFSPGNILGKRMAFLESLHRYQGEFPGKVKELMGMVKEIWEGGIGEMNISEAMKHPNVLGAGAAKRRQLKIRMIKFTR